MHSPSSIRVIHAPAELGLPELAADMVGQTFPLRQELIDQDWSFGRACYVLHPHDVQRVLTTALGVERATRHNIVFIYARYIAIQKSCCIAVEAESAAIIR